MSFLWRAAEVFGWFEDEIASVIYLERASRVALVALLCTRTERCAPLEVFA